MPKFEKELPMSPWKIILFSLASLASIALLIFVFPEVNPFGARMMTGALVLSLIISWWHFYFGFSVCEIEIASGFVNITWKSRSGKEKQASRQPPELYYQQGTTGGKGPRITLDLYEKNNTSIFKGRFMRIIDRTDGWKSADFPEIEAAFKAAGIENRERQNWF